MTTVTFKRSGGFIGQGMKYVLDLNHLPTGNAKKLVRLIKKAGFFNLPENLITKFMPDEYQYTLTVDVGITSHTVRTNDTTMPESLRPLVDELSSLRAVLK
jgi:transposase